MKKLSTIALVGSLVMGLGTSFALAQGGESRGLAQVVDPSAPLGNGKAPTLPASAGRAHRTCDDCDLRLAMAERDFARLVSLARGALPPRHVELPASAGALSASLKRLEGMFSRGEDLALIEAELERGWEAYVVATLDEQRRAVEGRTLQEAWVLPAVVYALRRLAHQPLMRQSGQLPAGYELGARLELLEEAAERYTRAPADERRRIVNDTVAPQGHLQQAVKALTQLALDEIRAAEARGANASPEHQQVMRERVARNPQLRPQERNWDTVPELNATWRGAPEEAEVRRVLILSPQAGARVLDASMNVYFPVGPAPDRSFAPVFPLFGGPSGPLQLEAQVEAYGNTYYVLAEVDVPQDAVSFTVTFDWARKTSRPSLGGPGASR